MRSSTAGMAKGGSSAEAPPLIDFGVDNHTTRPEHASGQAQNVDPFSWTTDELFISATPKDPFGFEGLFAAAPASDPGVASQSLGSGGGIDLLTGMSPVATHRTSAPAPVSSLLDVGGLPWAAAAPAGHREAVDSRSPASSSDGTSLFNDNLRIQAEGDTAQPWSPFYEESSFKDALSEDLPIAESPTSDDTGNAVDWSSIALAEKQGWAHEEQGTSSVVGEQANSDKEQQKPPVAAHVKERPSFSVTEKDAFTSEAPAKLVNAPPQKPPPPLPARPSSSEFQSCSWASSSRSRRQQPEFLASGGGRGVFRAPSRETFTSGNPVALELRPRPLKLKEVNQSIRTIMCTETSVWAAFDHGLKVWDIEAACSSRSEGSNNPLGDEDAAGYTVLTSGPTLCLAMDTGNQVVWTGHRDGKVRAWPLNIRGGDSQKRDPVEHVLVWDGHQAPVTAITITPYGESRGQSIEVCCKSLVLSFPFCLPGFVKVLGIIGSLQIAV
jgi:hypothetical protein